MDRVRISYYFVILCAISRLIFVKFIMLWVTDGEAWWKNIQKYMAVKHIKRMCNIWKFALLKLYYRVACTSLEMGLGIGIAKNQLALIGVSQIPLQGPKNVPPNMH